MSGPRMTVVRCKHGPDRGGWIWECDAFTCCRGDGEPYPSAAEANDAARAHMAEHDLDGIGWPR